MELHFLLNKFDFFGKVWFLGNTVYAKNYVQQAVYLEDLMTAYIGI